MKNFKNTNLVKLLLVVVVMVAPFAMSVLFAQPGPPPPPPPPIGVPIDGGILLLLSGLAAYGAKKIYNK